MTYSTVNPATGQTVRTFGDISDADLNDLLDTAQSCFQNDWRRRPIMDRARIVKAAAAQLRANAAEYAQYVTAEMGKLIVLEDADLEQAVAGALVGRMFNTGQSCVSSKRIIVVGHRRGEDFLRGFSEALGALQAGDPADPATTLGPLSSEGALDLILDQIRIARDGGAQVVLGGLPGPPPRFPSAASRTPDSGASSLSSGSASS